ncbi:hypothetical protein V8J88_15355 [Massilia sp. W12]|uniref:lipase-like domain-containing protein n=1 Tax=Massilia sp. W12 TaxID=3126507 RepID=UPI0030D0B26A
MLLETLKKYLYMLLACLALCAAPGQAAAAPATVIFVHGFMGFCEDEALGYRYWGGLDDIPAQLRAAYPDMASYSVCVGPLSSNYDRAIELFWKIKGGCIDYGPNHAASHGHERYFKNSSVARNTADARQCPSASAADSKNRAVYPAWDEAHPVHIVAHSQGGQTARLLAQLLANGGANPEGDVNLFAGHAVNARWIKSITTIATPNDGTTLVYSITDYVPMIQTLAAGIATFVGANPLLTDFVYDFKLDQWDVPTRGSGEKFSDYMYRVLNNNPKKIFTDRNVRDISTFDLSPDGAMRMNDWVQDQPDIYYFSYSTRSNTNGWISGWAYPRWDANPLIGLFCGPGFMGNYSQSTAPVIDASWRDTDCVVPTRAQKAPTLKIARSAPLGTAPAARAPRVIDISAGGAPQKGAWNWKGLQDGFDHLDITGWTLGWSKTDKINWYKSHINQLRSLP